MATNPPVQFFTYPEGLSVTPVRDMSVWSAFSAHRSLRFEVVGTTVTRDAIRLDGILANTDSVAHEVILMSFHVSPVPGLGIARRGPPPPPAAPPPPQRFEVPASARVRFSTSLAVSDYTFRSGHPAQLGWTFEYGGGVSPSGVVTVVPR